MKITRLEVSNFKLFAEKTFTFHPNFNLIVGVNGSGKTSLLRALSVALGGWAHAYLKDTKNRRPIQIEEIREICIDSNFIKTKATVVKAEGTADVVDRFERKMSDRGITWQRRRSEGSGSTFTKGSIDYGNGKTYPINFGTLGDEIIKFMESDHKFSLPLIAIYECDRLWKHEDVLSPEDVARTKISNFDGYRDCFHTAADHKAIGDWLLRQELIVKQKNVSVPHIESIHAAAKAALDNCENLRFDFDENRVLIDFLDGTTKAFEHLSDGQRTMLGLFCDIARRAALLNPHFGAEASGKTKGVVLIDELDLHLHPKWQRRIIADLKRIFPLIQFICTTHSPQLIGQAKPEEIIMLDDTGTATAHPAQSFGMDSNWILKHVMGGEDRDADVEKSLIKLFELIDDGEFDQARAMLPNLRTMLSGEHPDLIEAEGLMHRFELEALGDEKA